MGPPYDALDDFAGPGGWDQGARMVGLTTIGIEHDHAACQTANAAGHARIRADVSTYPSSPFKGVAGVISSPPCTLFSAAGTGVGKRVLDVLDAAIGRIFTGENPPYVVGTARAAIYPVTLAEAVAKNEKRTPEDRWSPDRVEAKARADALTVALVLEPARRIVELRPEWVALEQVPDVLPLWHVYRRELRALGYTSWTTILNTADYGVPQTRRRAVLGASRVRNTHPPEPTHAEHPQDADLFGDMRRGWVSMAEGLGRGMTGRDAGRWVGSMYEIQPHGGKRTPEQPALTITLSMDNGNYRWAYERPATTVVGSFGADIIAAPGYRTQTSRQNAPDSIRVEAHEAAILQGFPHDYPWHGTRTKRFQQIGNAVPPPFAAHILSALTGRQAPA